MSSTSNNSTVGRSTCNFHAYWLNQLCQQCRPTWVSYIHVKSGANREVQRCSNFELFILLIWVDARFVQRRSLWPNRLTSYSISRVFIQLITWMHVRVIFAYVYCIWTRLFDWLLMATKWLNQSDFLQRSEHTWTLQRRSLHNNIFMFISKKCPRYRYLTFCNALIIVDKRMLSSDSYSTVHMFNFSLDKSLMIRLTPLISRAVTDDQLDWAPLWIVYVTWKMLF